MSIGLAASKAAVTTEEAAQLSSPAIAPPRDLADVRLGGSPSFAEQAGSVTVNPKNPDHLTAAIYGGGECSTRSSADGGRRWTPLVSLPVPAGHIGCRDPSLTYSPDGERAYAAYAAGVVISEPDPYVLPASSLVVSRSLDGGATWQAPTTVLTTENNQSIYWAAVATPLRDGDGRYVYLLFAREQSGLPGSATETGALMFTRSTDRGQTWSSPQSLAQFNWPNFGNDFGFTGVSVAAGAEGDVLVAWTWQENDYAKDIFLNQVRVAKSANFGQSFAAPVIAVDDDVPLYSPDVKIGAARVAHIVYSRSFSYDEVEVQYIHSYNRRPSYKVWAPAVTLDADHTVFERGVSLALEPCGTTSSILHVAWVRPQGSRQDVYYARKVASPGYPWSTAIRVSNVSSPARTYQKETAMAARGGRAFITWTDARHNPPESAEDASNVYGSRVLSGVNCARGLPPR